MLTRCPHCETTFRVGVAAIRAAHGQVRCGRCMYRFDAIEQLVDDEATRAADALADAPTEQTQFDAATASEEGDEPKSLTDQDLARIFVDERDWNARWPQVGWEPDADPSEPIADDVTHEDIVVEEPTGLEEITLEGRRIEISGSYAHLDDEVDEGVTDGAHPVAIEIVLGQDEDEELLPPLPPDEILLPDDYAREEGFELRFTDVADAAPLQETEGAPALPDAEMWSFDRPPADTSLGSVAGVVPPTVIAGPPEFAPTRPAPINLRPPPPPVSGLDDLDDIGADDHEHKPRATLASLLSLLLAVLLLGQVVHHYRQDLVRHPRFGPMLGDIYTRLGMPLAPNWDPTGYEVQQWGIASLPGDASTLRLRASLTNRAGFPQPYPLLRLSLEDLWGAEVGVRDLEPQEYLPPGRSPDRMMAPGGRTDAEVRIVDPGEDAVGFRIDVCVRDDGAIRCAAGNAGAAQ